MIKLTDSARKRIETIMNSDPDNVGVLFSVVPGGCTGYSYKLDIALNASELMQCNQVENSYLWYYPDQEHLISGIEIDWVTQGFNQSFVFRNPNQTASCGCGTSFAA